MIERMEKRNEPQTTFVHGTQPVQPLQKPGVNVSSQFHLNRRSQFSVFSNILTSSEIG